MFPPLCSFQKLRSMFVEATFTTIWQPLRYCNRAIRTHTRHLQTDLFPQQHEMKQECKGEMRGANGSRRVRRGALRTAQGHLWRGLKSGMWWGANMHATERCRRPRASSVCLWRSIRTDPTRLSAFHGCCFTQNWHQTVFEETLSVCFCSPHSRTRKKQVMTTEACPFSWVSKKQQLVCRSAAVPSPCHFVPAQRRRV